MMSDSQRSQLQPVTDDLQRYQRTAKELISQFTGAAWQLQVTSESMLPILQAGDTIVVEPSHNKPLRQGDIVVCMQNVQSGGEYEDWVVHRLVGKSDQGWLTKGDHLRAFDIPVPRDAILGRVIQIVHQGERIDLQSFPWREVNRYLGFYHSFLGFMFTYLRRLRGRVKSV